MEPSIKQNDGNTASALGRGMPDFHPYDPSYSYVAYTLSMPETKKFMQLPALLQKKIYHDVFTTALKLFVTKSQPFKYHHEFEFTKKGKVHVHGIVKFKEIQPIEFLNDLAKYLCKVMTSCRQYNCRFTIEYNSKNFLNNDHGITYKSPAIFLDYIDNETGYDDWYLYMYKQYNDVVKL